MRKIIKNRASIYFPTKMFFDRPSIYNFYKFIEQQRIKLDEFILALWCL